MYMQHFGLEKQPFKAVAQGNRVFVGPRQARALANLKIALAMPDAIAVVAGPVGVGKSTLVGRVLDLVASKRSLARVGRTPMTVDEMLEHLLAEFGISGSGTGRMERLRTLRNYFKDCGATGVRAFILVEDAKALDVKLLAELEAVTAADADGSPGVNVILMGTAAVTELVDAPELEHLRQRTRLRQQLEPLNVEEIAGYVKHLLEMAGGDFQTIVDPQTPRTLRHCTGGIPRIINNLCETALTVAATNKMPHLLPHLVQRVAVTIYGIQPRVSDGQSARIVPAQNMAPPAPASAANETPAGFDAAKAFAAPEALEADEALEAADSTQFEQPTVAMDPEPTIVEEDLPEDMLEAADALADFEPAHRGGITQDIVELPAAEAPGDAHEPASEAAETLTAVTADDAPPEASEIFEQDEAALATDTEALGAMDAIDEPMIGGDWATEAEQPLSIEDGDSAGPLNMLDAGSAVEPEPTLPTTAAADLDGPAIFAAQAAYLDEKSAEIVLTESTRIKTLSVLDELAGIELAPAAPSVDDPQPPADLSGSGRSGQIDWSTWPLAADAGVKAPTPPPAASAAPTAPQAAWAPAAARTLAPTGTPAPTAADPDQAKLATPPGTAGSAQRPDPILAPVVGPAAGPPPAPPQPTRAAETPVSATPPAATPPRPSEPPTLTDVQPDAAASAKPAAAPPVLTEVFQVTARQQDPTPEAQTRAHTPMQPAPAAQPSPPAEPATPAATPTGAPPPASDLDFSVLLAASHSNDDISAHDRGADDVPVIIDPPALSPVAPEMQKLASQVAQVTNLADLDELLAETLFADSELEQLSVEIQAREAATQRPDDSAPAAAPAGSRPTPPPTGTDTTKIQRMAILAAMNGLGDDDDESKPKNAVG